MRDSYGRTIDYLRISITEQCNLRCRYCMPEHAETFCQSRHLMSFGEILSAARAAASLGVRAVKITGGEPLCRPGCPELIGRLKEIKGIRQVTMTTNGLLVSRYLDELLDAGLDGINISLDTLNEAQFHQITRRNFPLSQVLKAVESCSAKLPTKINAVLLPETENQLIPLARLACSLPVDVRFIEQMPLGNGRQAPSCRSSRDSVLTRLKAEWPSLSPVSESKGNGPAVYYRTPAFSGSVGLIEAVSHSFCSGCNRIRITSDGQLKPCLCYGDSLDLMPALEKKNEQQLLALFQKAVKNKPKAHCFLQASEVSERRYMSQIGG
jgi:cyclic pyranopterin phosphate synthase